MYYQIFISISFFTFKINCKLVLKHQSIGLLSITWLCVLLCLATCESAVVVFVSIAVLEMYSFRNINNVVFAPDSEKGEVPFLQRGNLSLPCYHWGAHYCGSICMTVSQCNSNECLWTHKTYLHAHMLHVYIYFNYILIGEIIKWIQCNHLHI